MSLISFSPLQDGVTGVNAAATNTPLSTIYNDYNGNITDANIASAAAIAGSKINLASVANPYKFSVYRAAAQSLSTGANTVISYDTKLYDTGSNVDVATNKGRFTAPIAGFYHFNTQLAIAPTTNGSVAYIALQKNGTELIRGSRTVIDGTDSLYLMLSTELQLAANDYIEVAGFASATTQALEISTKVNYFTGFLVSAT